MTLYDERIKLADNFSTPPNVLAELPEYALNIIVDSCIRAALDGGSGLRRTLQGRFMILVPQDTCGSSYRHTRCMKGCKMGDLNKTEQVALLKQRLRNGLSAPADDEIVVEPLFARFGDIHKFSSKKNGRLCYALELYPKYAKPTLEILKKIREERAKSTLVTDVDLMAREEPTSGKIDELEPLPQDHTVIAGLLCRCTREYVRVCE